MFVDDIGRWIEQRYQGRGVGAVYQPAAGAGAFLADVATGFDLVYADPPFNLAADPESMACDEGERPSVPREANQ